MLFRSLQVRRRRAVVHKSLRRVDKVPVVWEEMVLEHQVKLVNDTIVMGANVVAVVERGFSVVNAASDFFYLDCS